MPLAGDLWPVEAVKDVVTELPAGLVGDPTGADACTAGELANGAATQARPLCPATSQVGSAMLRFNGGTGFASPFGPVPVFNMDPPPGVPARFGMNVLGSVVTLDAQVRSGGDYGITIVSRDVPEALALAGTTVTLWGVPSDPSHDADRARGFGGLAELRTGHETLPAESHPPGRRSRCRRSPGLREQRRLVDLRAVNASRPCRAEPRAHPAVE